MYVNYGNKVCENLQTNIGAPMGIHSEKRARESEKSIKNVVASRLTRAKQRAKTNYESACEVKIPNIKRKAVSCGLNALAAN